jgi:hypothetical protein
MATFQFPKGVECFDGTCPLSPAAARARRERHHGNSSLTQRLAPQVKMAPFEIAIVSRFRASRRLGCMRRRTV